MNIIKFVSVALWSMCMLFLSCKKENPSLSETPATVEIFVCNSKGEPLENKTVGLYDESRYTDFQKDHAVKPMAEVITNQKGIAHFVLESRPWFVKGTSAELMFVVQELQDASNYKWWSRGGTVTLGKAHSFKIEVVYQDGAGGDETTEEKPGEDAGENVESPFETGLKKVTLPASLKKIGSQAFLGTHLEEVVFSAELQEIDDEAFRGVAELTSVTLSNNMQRIGYQAFSDCEQLSKVAYVGKMKTADCMVEIGAFQNCTSLTSFAFPQSLSEVQGWTFVGCRKLKEIILP